MSPDTARISEIIDRARISPYQILILTLCFLIALLDGFDTAIIGYIAPALREEWGLQPAQLSPAFGAGLFGLLIGSLLFGPLADAIGRKRVLLVAVLVFGGCTLASAYAHSIESLTLLRFITGIGLGGAIPTCITLSSEYSPARRRMLMVTLSWSGFTAGLALGGLLAGQIIPAFGWRGLLLVGGIAPLALLPLLAWQMPESVRFMAASAKHADRLRRVVERITGQRWTGDPLSMTSARRRPGRRSRTCLSKGAPCAPCCCGRHSSVRCSCSTCSQVGCRRSSKTPVSISPTPRASARWCRSAAPWAPS
ncbi:sugar (and other) transporter family protein [Serratia marcescens]|nr:sugar (and other) transporter family protein [Serratia marcescens]